jgi:hypothetical protein
MQKKPNYRFERAERDRRKAAKKADKLKARQDRTAPGDLPPDAAPAEPVPSEE